MGEQGNDKRSTGSQRVDSVHRHAPLATSPLIPARAPSGDCELERASTSRHWPTLFGSVWTIWCTSSMTNPVQIVSRRSGALSQRRHDTTDTPPTPLQHEASVSRRGMNTTAAPPPNQRDTLYTDGNTRVTKRGR